MKRSNDKWVGKEINDWKILDYVIGKNGIEWMCECKCGRIKKQKVWNVTSGKSRMCKACSAKLRRKESNI